MQTVRLSDVKPSPHPVRKTWDEDKMQELAASIAERGVIVPIKVRPTSDKFRECRYHGIDWLEGNQVYEESGESCFFCRELRAAHGIYSEYELEDMEDDERDLLAAHEPFLEIVYGHRRAEAARRAGLVEIPAIVDTPDDTDALIEALIENIVREGMLPYEKALGLRDLKASSGWTDRRIADALGWRSERSIGNFLALLRDDLSETRVNAVEDAQVFWQAQAGLGKEHQDALPRVIDKAVDEGLNRRETRAVADAYKAAPTPELKDAVLNTSGKLGDAERILQVAQTKVGVRGLAERDEHLKRQAFEEYDAAVKDFLDFMRLSERVVKTARDAAKFGKFSPEGARFAVGRIDRLIDELHALKDALA